MAVAIKNMGFTNITIYNGGLKDWVKSGNTVESKERLPEVKVDFIDADELMEKITEANKKNCVDSAGQPLLTLIDFRSSLQLSSKKGADKYRIKSNCRTITAFLDDFIDNDRLIQSIPKKGLSVSICETGNRDVFLVRYLSKFGRTNVKGLKYGMRNWLKADYAIERIEQTVKE